GSASTSSRRRPPGLLHSSPFSTCSPFSADGPAPSELYTLSLHDALPICHLSFVEYCGHNHPLILQMFFAMLCFHLCPTSLSNSRYYLDFRLHLHRLNEIFRQ